MDYTLFVVGEIYTHRSGGDYKCLRVYGNLATLERQSDKYTLRAHGTRMEADGKIHWDYSSGGHWPKESTK